MSRRIDYYFTLVSPWAWLGHDAFLDIARRHGLAVRFRPVLLNKVFPESGGLPLAQRHPLRQRYRLMELQRWREARGLPLNIHPKYWPFDVAAADRLVVAAQMAGADAGRLAGLLFRAVFVDERDPGQRQTLAEILAEGGFDADLLARAETETVARLYDATPAEALAAGVFGSPSWVLDGEVFWGQDRLELLEAALNSGRKAYSADL
jgi:2-hydroxychromene-2-carboxylate isomerase